MPRRFAHFLTKKMWNLALEKKNTKDALGLIIRGGFKALQFTQVVVGLSWVCHGFLKHDAFLALSRVG